MTCFASFLHMPGFLKVGEFDPRTRFLLIRRPLLASYGAAAALIVVDGSVLADEPLGFPGRIGHIAILIAVLVGLPPEKKRFQIVVAGTVLVALIYLTGAPGSGARGRQARCNVRFNRSRLPLCSFRFICGRTARCVGINDKSFPHVL